MDTPMALQASYGSSRLRRSDRIEVSIPIEVIGMDITKGSNFVLETETLTVSRHGGAIFLNCTLATSQELTIRCLSTNEEADAKVVGLMCGPWKRPVYGVAFIDSEVNPWCIEFPPLTGSDDGFARALLGCRSCPAQKVFHLNEIEILVFEANRSIQQFCKGCSATTVWSRSRNATVRDPVPEQQTTSVPATSVKNRRKHGRIRTNVAACIRQRSSADEIVVCENISRGGLSFQTSKPHQKEARIEIAVPYAAESGNIFVPARVVHVERLGKLFRLGVAFVSASETQQSAEQYSGSRTYEPERL
jgi:hypothetical protein